MSTDPRLVADLELLRVALGAYLARLRALWAEPAVGRAEIERLLAAAGVELAPADAERELAQMALQTASLNTAGPLARIVGALDLTTGEELLVAAAWWSESDPQVAVLLGCAHDDGARRHPSAALLRLLLAPFGIDAPPALDDGHRLVRFGVLEPGAGAREAARLTPIARTVLAGGTPEPMPATAPPPERHPCSPASSATCAPALPGPSCSAARVAAAAAPWPPRPLARSASPWRARRPRPSCACSAACSSRCRWSAATGSRSSAGRRTTRRSPPGAAAFRARAAYVVDVRPPTHRERAKAWRGELTGAGIDPKRAPSWRP